MQRPGNDGFAHPIPDEYHILPLLRDPYSLLVHPFLYMDHESLRRVNGGRIDRALHRSVSTPFAADRNIGFERQSRWPHGL